jgi:hypothetical protein
MSDCRSQHLGLRLEAHVADLIEEDRAAVGQLEPPAAPRVGAREGPLLVAEQLRFDQLLGNGRAVHLDERALAPGRKCVDGPRHQLLAAAVLAVDEDAAVGGGGHRDLLAERPDHRAVPDELRALVQLFPQALVLALEPDVLEGARHGHQRLVEGERLLDEVVGAQSRGLDRGLDGGVARDHHDRHLGPHALDPGQRFQAVEARHPDVEEDDVGRLVSDDADGLGSTADRRHPVALVLEHPAQRRLDRRFVVHDQDVLTWHGLTWGA